MDILIVFALGASIGSFLHLTSIRLPQKISIITPNSYCTACSHPIAWYHNLPIISYLWLRGKCAHCGKAFGVGHFLTELIVATLFVLLYLRLGISFELGKLSVFFSLLILLSLIDITYKAVPSALLLLALLAGVAGLGEEILSNAQDAIFGAGLFYLFRFIGSTLLKKEAMGEGDVVIVAALGAILGVPMLFMAIFLSSVIALPFAIYFRSKNELETPFIPFLTSGAIVTLLFEEPLSAYLVSLYG